MILAIADSGYCNHQNSCRENDRYFLIFTSIIDLSIEL